MRRALLLLPLVALFACDDGGGEDEDVNPVDAALALDGDAAAGASTFAGSCGLDACHGSDGDSGQGAELSGVIPNMTDKEIVSVMVNGTGDMVGAGLSDQENADVLAYLLDTY